MAATTKITYRIDATDPRGVTVHNAQCGYLIGTFISLSDAQLFVWALDMRNDSTFKFATYHERMSAAVEEQTI